MIWKGKWAKALLIILGTAWKWQQLTHGVRPSVALQSRHFYYKINCFNCPTRSNICKLQALCVQKAKQGDDSITYCDPDCNLRCWLDPVGHQLLQTGDNCGKCSANCCYFLKCWKNYRNTLTWYIIAEVLGWCPNSMRVHRVVRSSWCSVCSWGWLLTGPHWRHCSNLAWYQLIFLFLAE